MRLQVERVVKGQVRITKYLGHSICAALFQRPRLLQICNHAMQFSSMSAPGEKVFDSCCGGDNSHPKDARLEKCRIRNTETHPRRLLYMLHLSRQRCSLNGVFESFETFDGPLQCPCLDSPVSSRESKRCYTEQQQDQDLQARSRPEPIQIPGRVHFSECRGSNDATDGSESHLQRRTNRSLGLTANVVRLICQDGWDVSLASGASKKDSKVPNGIVLVVCSYHQADKADDRLYCNNGRTGAVFIPYPGKGECTEDSNEYRRR
jgi:hypothetical protein